MWSAAQWAIVISGLNLSFGLIFGVFAGVLAALQRFELTAGIAIAQTLIGATGTVWLLDRGYGIVPLAGMQLTIAVVLGIATVLLCRRVYPGLHPGFRFLERGILPELWRYSFYLFLIAATGQVIYYTDNLDRGRFPICGGGNALRDWRPVHRLRGATRRIVCPDVYAAGEQFGCSGSAGSTSAAADSRHQSCIDCCPPGRLGVAIPELHVHWPVDGTAICSTIRPSSPDPASVKPCPGW